MKRYHLMAVMFVCAAGFSACGTGSTCGLGLVERLSIVDVRPGYPELPFPAIGPGDEFSKEIVIPAEEELEIDMLVQSTDGISLVAFLAPSTCTQLFTRPYTSAATPQCAVSYGPVPNGTTGARKKFEAGRYKIFVEAPATNAQSATAFVDVGIWSTRCSKPILSPS